MSAYQVPEVDASSLFDNFTCRVGHDLVQQWSYRRDADPFTFSYQVHFQKKHQTLDVDDDDQGSSSSDEDYEQSKSVIFTDLKFVQDFSGKNEIGFEQGHYWIRLAFPESYLLNLHHSLTSTHPNLDLTPKSRIHLAEGNGRALPNVLRTPPQTEPLQKSRLRRYQWRGRLAESSSWTDGSDAVVREDGKEGVGCKR
ncbi:hypothetical protein CF327_g5873 [Tilletia walkeri]|nr:hypothetical protein CF327_g5873 [Tilletia walkeri]